MRVRYKDSIQEKSLTIPLIFCLPHLEGTVVHTLYINSDMFTSIFYIALYPMQKLFILFQKFFLNCTAFLRYFIVRTVFMYCDVIWFISGTTICHLVKPYCSSYCHFKFLLNTTRWACSCSKSVTSSYCNFLSLHI